MPTETWNSESRNNLDNGKSADAASANGRKRGPKRAQSETNF